MSSIPDVENALAPAYPPNNDAAESETTLIIIKALGLEKHIEGGYFAEIDRDPLTIPNPFLSASTTPSNTQTAAQPFSGDNSIRNASTSIYYLLTPPRPQGHFHRNKGRTVHTLIEGRGRYVLIHADEAGQKKRIETFVVGKDVSQGEKSVWIVEGGKFKASFLLPMHAGRDGGDDRLLISETVVPGFEYSDHDFLTMDRFRELVTDEQAKELEWLVRKS
ncbi:Nn.00g060350.m01.CDS01 [Neocucurbitaria sp. VM-36]